MLENFNNKIISLIPTNEEVVLAVSGGADSTCMALLFSQVKCFNVKVVIVDHKLREESTREATYVQKYLSEKFNFNFEILTWKKDYDVKSNIQANARDARYKLITDYCKQHSIKYFCTAHNKDDRAETVLMNIMRGTGIDGLCSMREMSSVNDIFLVRPLLNFTRGEIIDYLSEHSITWVNDPSNHNERYERVKVRKLLKIIEDSNIVNAKHFISRLNLLSDNALCANNFIKKYVNKKIKQICKFFALGVIIIDASQIILEEQEVILRILSDAIKKCTINNKHIRGDRLMSLYNLFQTSYEGNSFFEITLGGCMILFCSNAGNKPILLIIREKFFDGINFIKKNEVKRLKEIIINKKCEVFNNDLFNQASEIIKIIPKHNKIFYGTEFLLSANKRIYPTLGISEILF